MTKRTVLAGRVLVSAAVVAAFVTPPLAAPAAAASPGGPAVQWQTCRQYTDDELAAMGTPEEVRPKLRALLDRLQCGAVSVPLDYRRPAGRSISVAISRLPATDRAHRLGSLALNPGGPGGSGYLMPVELLLRTPETAGLNDRYDLIGFDPRGVGLSTKVDCPRPAPEGEEPDEPPLGPTTEAQARVIYASQVARNAACGHSDPAFLQQLTTLNVARDLDRVRAGLGEQRLNFLGVSWGTWLGAVYRNEFPARVGRMFLDSTAVPKFDLTSFIAIRAAAAEQDGQRFLAWVAARNDTYGLGRTAAEVRAAVIALVADYDREPRRFTDLPMALDGVIVAVSAAQPSPAWPLAAQVLKELRTATGPTAPPTLKQAIGGGEEPQEPQADLPERFNQTMGHAAFCNEDTSRPGFEAAWAAYRHLLAANPVTGRTNGFDAGCAGWPLPAQPVRLHRVNADVVLSGHRYESVSPYQWTPQMQRLTGGRVYTVEDDVHGSALMACTADIVGYFTTGRIDRGCPGIPVPTSTDLPGQEVGVQAAALGSAVVQAPSAGLRSPLSLMNDQ